MLTNNNPEEIAGPPTQAKLMGMLRIEWLGQTIASICWIISVFIYGIDSLGDWLQLFAASAWFIANIASLITSTTETRKLS